MMVAFLVSLMLNLLFLTGMIFVTVSERHPSPPAIAVTSVITEGHSPAVESPGLRRTAAAPIRGGGPSLQAMPIAAAAAGGEFTMTVPDLPSFDTGVAGLSGIDPAFGAGFDAGPGPGLGNGPGGMGGTGGDGASMKVGKLTVKARRLGVVLDISGSMQVHLPGVKKELRRTFSQAKIVEVEGCGLHWNRSSAPEKQEVRLRSSADSVVEAVEMLVADAKVDAIYWFSDLQDGESEQGLSRLGELLNLEKGKGRAVRLYIRSLERKPSTKLAAIVRTSGGAVQAGGKEE